MTRARFFELRSAAAVRQGRSHEWVDPWQRRLDDQPSPLVGLGINRCAILVADMRRRNKIASHGKMP